MDTTNMREIADRLVALCRKGDFETAQKELFSSDAVSIEPYATSRFEKEARGLNAIFEKGRKFERLVEAMHTLEVSEPIVADHSFACTMRMDATFQGKGRVDMRELCVYEVKNGKIVSEQFHL